MSRGKQATEFVDDIDESNLIQIKEYEGMELDRYYFDMTNKRILFYMPIHRKYKLLKPSQTSKSNEKYKSVGLVSKDNGMRRTKSYNKLMKTLIQMYCQESGHE